jgi:hypothetical protein
MFGEEFGQNFTKVAKTTAKPKTSTSKINLKSPNHQLLKPKNSFSKTCFETGNLDKNVYFSLVQRSPKYHHFWAASFFNQS